MSMNVNTTATTYGNYQNNYQTSGTDKKNETTKSTKTTETKKSSVESLGEKNLSRAAQKVLKDRQCQMTYEKTEQKKKAQMNLENCRSFRLWQPTATLDGTKKNCCRLITDGEELKNSQSFSVDYSSVAVLFRAIKGTPLCGGWDNYLWL